MCNELVTYKQLLKEQGKSTEPTVTPPPARIRSERARPALPSARPPRQREPLAALPPVDEGDEGDIKTVEELAEAAAPGDEEDAAAAPAARRRRRRRGRARSDEGAGEGAETPTDAASDEADTNGRANAAVDELVPVQNVDALVPNGLAPDMGVTDTEAAESGETEAAPRAPRRRRRPATSQTSSESPAEQPSPTS
jgi:hypothetical protein